MSPLDLAVTDAVLAAMAIEERMTTTKIPIHMVRKNDEIMHPVTGQVCTVVSSRVLPNSSTERRIKFHNGRGIMALDMGPSVQVVVK